MEPLLDPKKDRQIKTTKPPPARPLSSELVFDNQLDPGQFIRKTKLENNSRSFKKRRLNAKVRCSQNHKTID